MNHSFSPSQLDSLKCAICKYPELSHGNDAICETCDKVGPVELKYGNMLMCPTCIENEQKLSNEAMKPENQQIRVDSMNNEMNVALEKARQLDASIQVRTDLFNAATVSIIELKRIIDEDSSIENKNYALASELQMRFNHFKSVIFEMNEKIIEAGNQQKAIQVYLNQLANQLRQEEREKLKISDINYKPSGIKTTKISTIKTVAKRLDKVELRKYASELGVNEFTLQMLVVSKGITVEQAANMLRRSIKEAKSESE